MPKAGFEPTSPEPQCKHLTTTPLQLLGVKWSGQTDVISSQPDVIASLEKDVHARKILQQAQRPVAQVISAGTGNAGDLSSNPRFGISQEFFYILFYGKWGCKALSDHVIPNAPPIPAFPLSVVALVCALWSC